MSRFLVAAALLSVVMCAEKSKEQAAEISVDGEVSSAQGEENIEKTKQEDAFKAHLIAEDLVQELESLKKKEANPEDDDPDAKTPDEIRKEKIRLYKEIIRHYRMAAALGHVESKYELAQRLFKGVSKHQVSELRRLQKLVATDEGAGSKRGKKGQASLRTELDLVRALGTGPKFNRLLKRATKKYPLLKKKYKDGKLAALHDSAVEALRWMNEAASDGYAKAMFNVANILMQIDGPMSLDLAKAKKMLHDAADKGYASAAADLGRHYTNGMKIGGQEWKKDNKLARRYLKKAVKANDASAMRSLAGLYCKGIGVKRNYTRCFKLTAKAAKRGDAPAKAELAFLYQQGRGVERNNEKFLEILKEAADSGFPEAQYRLGMAYFKGMAVEEDKKEAAKWFVLAAKKHHIQALYSLGVMALQREKYKDAYDLFMRCKHGEPKANFNLGMLLEAGNGVPKDLERAKEFFRVASEAGVPDAATKFAHLDGAL